MTPDKVYLKPAREGLVIRDPQTMQALPAEGAEVRLTTFWTRRMRDGDVVRAAKPRPTAKKEG